MVDLLESDGHEYDWRHFAARSGEPGAAWAAEYEAHASVVALSNEALGHFRARRFADGCRILDEYDRACASLNGIPGSMRRVLDRWYHGVEAYRRYGLDDFDGAADGMNQAHDAVVEAVSRDGFLMMLTIHCLEFRLHHARIARNRRSWDELDAHVRHARSMVEGRRPLCELADGRPVYFSTIGEFMRSVGPLNAGEVEVLREVTDADLRLARFDEFVRRLRVLPDFAIRY